MNNIMNNIDEYKTHFLIINSEDRNKSSHPNPNNYTYEFIEPYKNIISVELLETCMKPSDDIINASNNILRCRVDGISPNTPGIFDTGFKDLIIPISNYLQDPVLDIYPVLYKNMHKKISEVFQTWENYDNIACLFDYNQRKYYIYNKTDVDYDIDLSGPNKAYRKPDNISINFKGNKKIYDSYTIKVNNEHKRVVLDYDDYHMNSIGQYLGFKAKEYTNKIKVENIEYVPPTSPTDSGTLDITFGTQYEFDQFYNIIILKNKELPVYIKNESDFFILDFSSNYIKIISYNNLKIKLKTYALCTFTSSSTKITSPSFTANTIILPIVSEYIYNLDNTDSVLLQISEFNRYDSRNKEVQNSFIKIPLSPDYKQYSNTKSYGTIKNLNPNILNLNKITLTFKKTNGSYYNFNGRDHSLLFAITTKLNPNI